MLKSLFVVKNIYSSYKEWVSEHIYISYVVFRTCYTDFQCLICFAHIEKSPVFGNLFPFTHILLPIGAIETYNLGDRALICNISAKTVKKT